MARSRPSSLRGSSVQSDSNRHKTRGSVISLAIYRWVAFLVASIIIIVLILVCFPSISGKVISDPFHSFLTGLGTTTGNAPGQQMSTQPTVNPNHCKNWLTHGPLPVAKDQAIPGANNMPLWGSYRPDVFFGMKTRSPNALATGLAWTSIGNVGNKLRHAVHQDEITLFHWLRHNGKTFGQQELIDRTAGQRLLTSFITATSSDLEQPSWIQRINSYSIQKTQQPQRRLFFYFGVECSDRSAASQSHCISHTQLQFHDAVVAEDKRSITLIGRSELSGWFSLEVKVYNDHPSCDKLDDTCPADLIKLSFLTDGSNENSKFDVWSGIDRLQQELSMSGSGTGSSRRQRWLSDDGELTATSSASLSSYFLAQVETEVDCVVDIIYNEHLDASSPAEVRSLLQASMGRSKFSASRIHVDDWLRRAVEAFDETFDDTFQQTLQSPYSPDDTNIAKMALSSVLGGIGYFHGQPKIGDAMDIDIFLEEQRLAAESESAEGIDKPQTRMREVLKAEAISLLTGTPSRAVFPRGFLWDEGFHQLLVSEWDPSISQAVVSHWLHAMYRVQSNGSRTGGWIPREMILGDVASTRVPDEFIVQNVNIANPPTLLLVLEKLLDKNSAGIVPFLQQMFPLLHDWVQWYLYSQQGPADRPGSFRWRGRSPSDSKVIPNTLASGLDDYPRGLIASPLEYHVDLLAWMIKACGIMARIQGLLGDKGFDYQTLTSYLTTRLDDLHWSEEHKSYLDVGFHHNLSVFAPEVFMRCTDGSTQVDLPVPVHIVNNRMPFCPASHPTPMYPLGDGNGGYKMREVLMLPENVTLQREHIPRIGYVNIFPLMLKLLPADSDKLTALLDHIESPDHLW